jgi:hypothetical protein
MIRGTEPPEDFFHRVIPLSLVQQWNRRLMAVFSVTPLSDGLGRRPRILVAKMGQGGQDCGAKTIVTVLPERSPLGGDDEG